MNFICWSPIFFLVLLLVINIHTFVSFFFLKQTCTWYDHMIWSCIVYIMLWHKNYLTQKYIFHHDVDIIAASNGMIHMKKWSIESLDISMNYECTYAWFRNLILQSLDLKPNQQGQYLCDTIGYVALDEFLVLMIVILIEVSLRDIHMIRMVEEKCERWVYTPMVAQYGFEQPLALWYYWLLR